MNYILGLTLSVAETCIIIWNQQLSEKLGAFYARRYSATFGKLASFLRLDDPNTLLNRFMYRGFVITAGIILLLFAIGAFLGTNFTEPSTQPAQSLLQQQS